MGPIHLEKRMPAGSRFKGLTGERFNRWSVIELAGFAHGHSYWKCRCDCGSQSVVSSSALRFGKSRGCYCVQRDSVTTHGMSYSPEYYTWQAMIARCYNPRNKRYADYGGRGIRVFQAWRESFDTFLARVGPRPSDGHSIDRYPNNNGNYEPGNVRWATSKQQAANRRSNVT